jgi:LDH2 family malate/lactate/ureidoglycolate dehydrogenase
MDDRFRVPEEIAVRVDAEDMHATVEGIFRSLGAPEEDARRCADGLIYADLRGIDSHGVSNMTAVYVAWMKDGSINPAPVMKVIRDAPAAATVDSDGGLGLTIGPQAMELAMDKAEACGVGTVVVTNGRHYGAAAYTAAMALERDMIGISLTMGGLQVVPTFGSKAMIGLNPIGFAAPARHEAPFVFDASTSSTATNKIRNAKRLGVKLPGAWIATLDGTPIMEEAAVPEEFLVLPLGGTREIGSHKGYSLAVMVDILSGILGGDPPGFRRAWPDVSHHFTAYRIDAFTELDGFKDQMDLFLKGLRETPPAPGEERVLYAGLPEHEVEAERRERGIPYHPKVISWFRRTAEELGVAHRLG